MFGRNVLDPITNPSGHHHHYHHGFVAIFNSVSRLLFPSTTQTCNPFCLIIWDWLLSLVCIAHCDRGNTCKYIHEKAATATHGDEKRSTTSPSIVNESNIATSIRFEHPLDDNDDNNSRSRPSWLTSERYCNDININNN
jgi:hypothetical protein